MHYQWDFAFLLRYTPLFWKGVLVTLAAGSASFDNFSASGPNCP